MNLHIGLKETINFDNGELILMNKPIDWTSFDVVARIRSLFNIKKIGHAGTLDPKATGLLILCTGKMTKQISEFQDFVKEYKGVFEIGSVTKSFDSETEVYDKKEVTHITASMIEDACLKFIGIQKQIPPMFSAVKVNGRRLYKYARQGKNIVRNPRTVLIDKFDLDSFESPFVDFSVVCSKGTYIRSLVNDVGEILGCGAYLKTLTRTRIGPYLLRDAMNIEDLHLLRNKIQQVVV